MPSLPSITGYHTGRPSVFHATIEKQGPMSFGGAISLDERVWTNSNLYY